MVITWSWICPDVGLIIISWLKNQNSYQSTPEYVDGMNGRGKMDEAEIARIRAIMAKKLLQQLLMAMNNYYRRRWMFGHRIICKCLCSNQSVASRQMV